MKNEKIATLLKEEDFHIDKLGRIVIDNTDVLKAINGAAGDASQYDSLWNGACHNSRCG